MEQTGLNKKRIKREKPNKKRSEKEIQSILDFLQDAPEVELIESTKIDATWDLIRWKVRHLKASYKKASDWRMSTGAGLLESDTGTSSVEGKVLQMCSHFNQLKHIFGKKATSELPFEVVDSGSTSIMNESAANQILEITFSDVGEEIASPIDITNIENLPPGNVSEVIVHEKAKDFAENMKKHVPKSSAANLVAFQVERRQMFKMKMEWEKEKHEKDHALKERN